MNKDSIDYINKNYIKTMKELIDYSSYKYGEKVAIKYIVDGEVIEKSYIQFRNDVYKMADYIHSLNLEHGHVAILGDVSYEWIVSFYGIVSAGLVVVPIDKLLPKEELVNLIFRADVDCIIFDNAININIIEAIKVGSNKVKNTLFMKNSKSNVSVLKIITQHNNVSNKEYNISTDDVAAIVYTSGTTGLSKGVILTHKNLCDDLMCSYYLVGHGNNRATIPVLPTYHMFEFTTGIQSPIYIGFPICIGKGVKYITQSMKIYKPTILILVPMIVETMYKKILAEARKNNREKKLKIVMFISNILLKFKIDIRKKAFKDITEFFGGNLHTIVCGGAPLRDELVKAFRCFGIELLNGYGITECSPVVACNMIGKSRMGSVGVVAPKNYCEVIIKDDEVLIKGSIVTKGYYKNEKATKEAFEDGWFKTGDVGYIDKNGFLFITGRKNNLIILDNGENVSPEELESIFGRHELIKELVIHATLSRGKQKIVASIYPNEAYAIDNVKEILEMHFHKINQTLPAYKRVMFIEICDKEFEKTSTGKIKRKLLN